MADELFLSNSVAGFDYLEETFSYNFLSETSVHGASAVVIALGVMPRAGKVVDVVIGTVRNATSASGFVSATTDVTVRINSAAVCSTDPAIPMAGSAGAAIFKATNASGGTSAVVNPASADFAKGARLSLDYNLRSVGSAAAGATGTGLYVSVKVRYSAV